MKKLFFLMCALCTTLLAGAANYVKVTDAPADWSGTYILVYENEDGGANVFTGVDDAPGSVTATIADNTISGDSFVEIDIASVEGGYSLKVLGGDNVNKYMGVSSYSNGLKFTETSVAHTLSIVDNSVKIAIPVDNKGTQAEVTMRYNKANDQLRFRYYKSGQQAVQLYKKAATTEEGGGNETPDTTPVLKADKEIINFGSIEEGGSFEAQTLHVDIANITGAIETVFESGDSYTFGVAGTLSATGGDLTITVKTKKVGKYTDNLWIFVGEENAIVIPVTAEITEKAATPDPGEESTNKFELVTDASKLAADDQVIIVAANSDFALSTEQKSNNRGQTAITKENNTITPSTDVQILTLKAGNKANTFAFYTGEGYLYAASSSSNHLKTESTLSDNSSFTIEIATGIATVKAQGTNTRNLLKYNSSSSIFSCYGSGQGDIQLYKKQVAGGVEVPATTITLSQETLSLEQYREAILTATLTPDNATTSIVWSSDNEAVVTVSAGAVKAVGVGSATITATAGTVSATCAVTVAEATVLLPSAAAAKAITVTENNAKYEGGQYIVEGYVTEVSNAYSTKYGNMSVKLADTKDGEASLEAYQTVPADVENLPTVGAKVRVIGYLTQYSGKAQILKGSALTVLEAGIQPEEKGLVTVAEFLAAKDDFNIYTLKGTVTNITNTEFGNFDLVDATGTIYIYGLLDLTGTAKQFASLGIEAGDIVTLKGSYTTYNSTPQIASAQYVSHETPDPGIDTALENAQAEVKAVKVIENGQLIIIKDGVRYNVLGTVIK